MCALNPEISLVGIILISDLIKNITELLSICSVARYILSFRKGSILTEYN